MFHYEFSFLLQEPIFLGIFLDFVVIVNKVVIQEVKWIVRRDLSALSDVLIIGHDLL